MIFNSCSDYCSDLFKNEHRGGTAYAQLIRTVATHLTPEQMRDVSHYYASLTAAEDRSSQ